MQSLKNAYYKDHQQCGKKNIVEKWNIKLYVYCDYYNYLKNLYKGKSTEIMMKLWWNIMSIFFLYFPNFGFIFGGVFEEHPANSG